MAKLFLVDDDKELCELFVRWAKLDKHSIEVANTAQEALFRLSSYSYELLLLDLGLPDMDGVQVVKEVRGAGHKLPIIILSGRHQIDQKEKALDAGADDYVTKPFHFRELASRVKAVLRRPVAIQEQLITIQGLTIYLNQKKVEFNGKEVKLAPKEFALLEFLAKHPDQLFTAKVLLQRIWVSESDTSPDAVRVYMTRLRSKFSKVKAADLIKTQKGYGYKIESKPSD